MFSFLANPDMMSTLSGAAAFAVMVLVWKAFTEGPDLSMRLKAIAERREELEGTQRVRRGNKQR